MGNISRVVTLGVLCLMFILCLLPVGETVQAAAIEMDAYTATDTDNAQIYAGNYYAQSFVASQTYIVSKVRLKLSKTWASSSDKTVGVYICELADNSTPDLDTPVTTIGSMSTGLITTTTAGAWYDFTLTGTLVNGFHYAIVVYNSAGDASNVVNWRYDDSPGTYANGVLFASTDGGFTWAPTAATDFLFSVWGEEIERTDYEGYVAGDNATVDVYGVNWYGQTFTTGTALHDIEYVQLKLERTGTGMGDLYVAVVDVSSLNVPVWIGEDDAFAVGSITGELIAEGSAGWYYVPMSSEPSSYVSFRADYSTTYALVVYCPDGTAANYISWSCNDSDGWAGGDAFVSANSGVAWTEITSDFMFRITGDSTLRIIDVMVVPSYIEAGDMLILIHYIAWMDKRFPDPKLTFFFALDNTTHAIAKTGMNAWGYRPGCIYLSSAQTNSLPTGGIVSCNVTLAPYTETCDNATYRITVSNLASSVEEIDPWVRDTAQLMNIYYDPDISVYSEVFSGVTLLPGQGLLTEMGGEMFSTGIYSLDNTRPHLFYMIKRKINPDYAPYVDKSKKNLLDTVGPQFYAVLDSWGSVFNMSAQTFAMLVMLAISLGTAGVGMFVAQDVRGSLVGAVPISVGLVVLGFLSMPAWGVGLMILVIAVVFVFVIWRM